MHDAMRPAAVTWPAVDTGAQTQPRSVPGTLASP
jgi:hypothetical protein